MNLNFSNEYYKNKSINFIKTNIHTPANAFMLLINGLEYENLSNLCLEINKILAININDCYKLTQNLNINEELKNIVYSCAINCLNDNKFLGTKTINDGKINTSAWINHCLHSSIMCKNLANILGIDESKAETLGLLHDFGRKYDHSLNHTIKGFEKLIDIGWNTEAIGCLTHSFLNGNRCANNDPATEGFYIDDYGNPNFRPNSKKDDISIFLENYNFTNYDIILNLADLTATSNGILSPYERIQDIATRRQIDPINRKYFLCELTNTLINFIKIMTPELNYQHIKATKDITLEQVETYFKKISEIFFNEYTKSTNNTKKITI